MKTNEVGQPGALALGSGSGQLTQAARHYGITTTGAAMHLTEMLGVWDDDPNAKEDWDTLTGFDRACIGEVLAWTRKQGLWPNTNLRGAQPPEASGGAFAP